MIYPAERKSGNSLEVAERVIIDRRLGNINMKERRNLLQHTRIYKKIANRQNPLALKASDAVLYEDLIESLRRVNVVDCTELEVQIVVTFAIVFCTVSRSHEIAFLMVGSVSVDEIILLRGPKPRRNLGTILRSELKMQTHLHRRHS